MTPGTDPDVLTIRAWWEPELATGGHDPLGPYAETYWLPVLGPAATLAHRWLARGLRDNPQGYQIELGDLAHNLGLGRAKGRNGPAARALDRLCYFGLARHRDTLDVRTHVPILAPHLERRLPRSLRERHTAFTAGSQPRRAPSVPPAPCPPSLPPPPRPPTARPIGHGSAARSGPGQSASPASSTASTSSSGSGSYQSRNS